MLARLKAFADRANTYRNFWLGFVGGSLFIFAIGAREAGFSLWATSHLGVFGGIAIAFVDGAAAVGVLVVWPFLVAAAFGRPPNVPPGPVKG